MATPTPPAADRPAEPGGRDMLDAVAALLGKRIWRHVHFTDKFGGKCATLGCDCAEQDCHGVVCGMQVVIDQHDAAVRAEARVDSHAVAWQDERNIICTCGLIFSHDYGKSPARILGSTSDYYLREHCGDRYARHLREVRTNPTPGGTP